MNNVNSSWNKITNYLAYKYYWQYDLFIPAEMKSAIEGLKGNKASGTDSVFAEHLK